MLKNRTETKSPDKQDSNPLSQQDKAVARISPDIETDAFSPDEQIKIVKMVIQDARSNIESMAEWIADRKLDIQMYEGDKPSKLEGLDKKPWQSDRNLGQVAATCDSYQATLLATCWNPETINFKDTKENEVNRKDDITNFTKWGLGRAETDVFHDVDDFIHNRVTQGFSVANVYWKVWYQWVDRRIPKKNKEGKTIRYEIKTEKVRFEKGIIENIANLDDFLTPTHGKSIQDLAQCIRIIHLTGEDIEDYGKRNIFMNVDENFTNKLKNACFDWRVKTLGKEKAQQLGLKTEADITSIDLRVFPIDIYRWYGTYTKNGRTERYRFDVEPITGTLLSGKPLRKVPGCRTGKYPFVGGPFIRRPGFIRGKSMPRLIMHITNALNNIYNQKSDFQYVENCPFGFHKPDENYGKQEFDLIPGISYPTEDPNSINFPNLSRSMAWAEADIRLLLELLERMTGAAAYFMSNNQGVSGTATRDNIINEKSETRYGLWVKRIQDDIAEAIDMWVSMYQDCAPPTLAERVLGEDGKRLFNNLSIETLQGNYSCWLSPDIISGSKSMEKQIFLWAYEQMAMNIWFQPQMNPRGSWQLTVDSYKKIGIMNIEDYMPPKPPEMMGDSKEVEREFSRFMQGEDFPPVPGENTQEHLMGHMKQKEEQYSDLDEEYRPAFDDHLFKTQLNYMNEMQKAQEQMIANQMATQMIRGIDNGTVGGKPVPQMAPQQMLQQPMQQGQPMMSGTGQMPQGAPLETAGIS